MRRLTRREWVLLGFAALAVVQAILLTWPRSSAPSMADRWFTTNDTLAFPEHPDFPPSPTSSGKETPTILLVFNSGCGHCLEVAPLWRAWTRTSTAGARMVALSSESQGVAEAFVSEHGWNAVVWTVDASQSGSPNHMLTSRAPWVFVLDHEGVILAEGHGKDIAEITAVLTFEPRSTP